MKIYKQFIKVKILLTSTDIFNKYNINIFCENLEVNEDFYMLLLNYTQIQQSVILWRFFYFLKIVKERNGLNDYKKHFNFTDTYII